MLAVLSGSTARVAAALLLACVTVIPTWTGAAGPASLSGSVRDTLGRLLTDVEVLFVLAASESVLPAARVQSDDTGRFVVERLAPGRYRVAALKEGYLTFVGQVDTLVQDTVNLVLHPALRLDPAPIPENGSWVLRLPRRGILREVDAPPVAMTETSDREPVEPAEERFVDAMSLRIEQLFAVGAAPAKEDAASNDVRATETRMQMASTLGERGKLSVEGRHESIGGSGASEDDAQAAQRGASVRLGLSYETGADAQLDLNAFFNQADYRLSAGAPGGIAALMQEQRTWGYDASWSKQIDAISRVGVEVDYADTSLAQPRSDLALAQAPAGSAPRDLSNRAVAAQGSYERLASPTHDVEVALGAQLLQAPVTIRTPSDALLTGLEDPFSRWSVRVEAQDTWSLAAPFSLVYGLGAKHDLMSQDATLIVPKLGGAVSAGDWFLSAMVSYHTVAGANRADLTRPTVRFRPENTLGYEASLEFPVAQGVKLKGTTSYAPVQFDDVDHLEGRVGIDTQPLYLTDGNTAVRAHRLVLVEERGLATTYLEYCNGRAVGTVAPLLPFGTPLLMLSDGLLFYQSGRLGLRFPTRGTDVGIEYSRVESRSAPDLEGAGDSLQESVELRVQKDIPVFQVPGDWRLLLALKLGSVASETLEEWEPYGGTDSLEALNQRFSAGVSVAF